MSHHHNNFTLIDYFVFVSLLVVSSLIGVFFGWKDFYVKDHPMLTPRQTITRTPRLSMISYQ